MSNLIRKAVSQNKIRLVSKKYDLDLSYITDNIIAMGFPSIGLEAIYRNQRKKVVEYLDETHGVHYRVYNLCGETKYRYGREVFHGRVSSYPFPDHNPCTLSGTADFCCDAEQWLKQDASNVVVVHCKAGRGRTGYMVVCLLLHLGIAASPEEAVELFSQARTIDGNALHHPSQFRFIDCYFQMIQQHKRNMELRRQAASSSSSSSSTAPSVAAGAALQDVGMLGQNLSGFFEYQDPDGVAPFGLQQVAIHDPQRPASLSKGADFSIRLVIEEFADTPTGAPTRVLFDGTTSIADQATQQSQQSFLFNLDSKQGELHGDIRIQAFDVSGKKSSSKKSKNPLFRLWFHPAFVRDDRWVLRAGDMDAVSALEVEDEEEGENSVTRAHARRSSLQSPTAADSKSTDSLFSQMTAVVISFTQQYDVVLSAPPSPSSASMSSSFSLASPLSVDFSLSAPAVPRRPSASPRLRPEDAITTPTPLSPQGKAPVRPPRPSGKNWALVRALAKSPRGSKILASPRADTPAATVDECLAQINKLIARSLLNERERTELWLKLAQETQTRLPEDARVALFTPNKTEAKRNQGDEDEEISLTDSCKDIDNVLEKYVASGEKDEKRGEEEATTAASVDEDPGAFGKSRRAVKRLLNHERSLGPSLQKALRCVVWPLQTRLAAFTPTPEVGTIRALLVHVGHLYRLHAAMWLALEQAAGEIAATVDVLRSHMDDLCLCYEQLFAMQGYPQVVDELLRANPEFAQFLRERDAYARGVDTQSTLLAFMNYPAVYESALSSFLQDYKAECAIEAMNRVSSASSKKVALQEKTAMEALSALTRRLSNLSRQLADEKSGENVSFHVLQVNKFRQATKRVIEIDVQHKTLINRHLPGSATKSGKTSQKWKKAPTVISQKQLTRIKYSGGTTLRKTNVSDGVTDSSTQGSAITGGGGHTPAEQQLTVYFLKNKFLMRSEQSMKLQFFSTHERDRFAVLVNLLLLRADGSDNNNAEEVSDADLQAAADLYHPQPVSISSKALERAKALPVASVAEALHNAWMTGKQNEGWQYFTVHSEEHKTSPLLVEFKQLPAKTQQENLEIAELTMGAIFMLGYTIDLRPDQMEDMHVTRQLSQLTEFLAENAHDTWAEGKIRDGWTFAKVRHNPRKQHPLLLPYVILKKEEQESDRRAAKTILEAVTGLGYHISELD